MVTNDWYAHLKEKPCQHIYTYISSTRCVILISKYVTAWMFLIFFTILFKKVQVGKDQEKAKSEKDSHSKNRGDCNLIFINENCITFSKFAIMHLIVTVFHNINSLTHQHSQHLIRTFK